MKAKNHVLATLFFTAASCCAFASETFTETLYPQWGQTFHVSKVLAEHKNPVQHLQIIENETWGKVLILDGIVQATEKDEFVYHEMLTHVPLLAHGNAQNILVIGGGDGGIVREVLRHKNVKNITLVEIDREVIDFCHEHLPSISQGSLYDPRVHVIIENAYNFVGYTREKFDVIICDTTDPIGPGEILFTSEFYARCKRALNAGGIIVAQCGVPFLQTSEMVQSHKNLGLHCKDTTFFTVNVPTYVGGPMVLLWGSDNKNLRGMDAKVLEQRMRKQITGELKYYTPELQNAAFVLPKFIKDALVAGPKEEVAKPVIEVQKAIEEPSKPMPRPFSVPTAQEESPVDIAS